MALKNGFEIVIVISMTVLIFCELINESKVYVLIFFNIRIFTISMIGSYQSQMQISKLGFALVPAMDSINWIGKRLEKN